MRRSIVLLALFVPVLVAVGVAVAAGAFDGAKSSTARFHDLDQAKAAGYTVTVADLAGITCIEDPNGTGTMGVHMLNPDLLFDGGVIDAAQPEILVYEPRNDGTLKLVALEYLVLAGDWQGASKPALFGQEFDTLQPGNRYGLPLAYALHAWLWKPNPNGILKPYNPRVDCG
ncbi:MAG: hypothetical protein H0T13_05900 [Actinobacteria bacterium]|nr:hypothetical protein [Actinomycetota bacterium]